jgi:hypothetical protein
VSSDLRALYRTISNLIARVEKLEQQNRFTTASDWMPANWWGRVNPTNPASRIVNVHGGYLWTWDGAAGNFLTLPDTIFDFSAVTAFAGSAAYRWSVLQADLATNPPTIRLHEGEEFAARIDAESDFFNNSGADGLYTGYLPLAAIMLRNNGTLGGAVGAIENITFSDQDMSYFLARDFRPWLHLHI